MRSIKSFAFNIVFQILLVQSFLPAEVDGASLTDGANSQDETMSKIDGSMTEIVDVLQKISTTLKPKVAETCTGPIIDDLTNADTDWNPKATYAHGDIVKITCSKLYMTQYGAIEQTATCLLGNAWSTVEQCSRRRTCTVPIGNLLNADSEWEEGKEYYVGDTVNVACQKNWKTESNTTEQSSTCLPDNRWSSFETCSTPIVYCPPSFTKYRSVCVHIDYTDRSLDSAQTYCEGLYPEFKSTIAVFKTETEQNDFMDYLRSISYSTKTWFGAIDKDVEGTIVWVDGSDFNRYSSFVFNSGEIGNYDENEDCFAIMDYKLYDEECYETRNSFCTVPLPQNENI